MTTNWTDITARRADSDERRHGYEHAGRAIRLAFEIRALREKKGLSQRQLAELVGTTQSAIARLEGGRISPSLPTLDRIANALDANPSSSKKPTSRLTPGGPGVSNPSALSQKSRSVRRVT